MENCLKAMCCVLSVFYPLGKADVSPITCYARVVRLKAVLVDTFVPT
ncbi:hypothetical protein [Salmonella phage SD-13_S19]|nr:hypothetical protein [Salmonella phage SD-11_S17]WPK20348.1 hypothetical protein [Salmonella phage SD-13_S19]WPK20438.1 hypothetical protein [Salmonella phage SD-14_S20]